METTTKSNSITPLEYLKLQQANYRLQGVLASTTQELMAYKILEVQQKIQELEKSNVDQRTE